MSDKINLTQLRKAMLAGRRRDPEGYTFDWDLAFTPSYFPNDTDILALIDTAEAAREPLETLAAIIDGRHLTARLQAPHGLSSRSAHAALETLARYTTGEDTNG